MFQLVTLFIWLLLLSIVNHFIYKLFCKFMYFLPYFIFMSGDSWHKITDLGLVQ